MGHTSSQKTIKQAHVILVTVVLATAALYLVPQARQIAYPLILLSTMVHEMGHGLAALLVGGTFNSFHMYSDGSGLANISGEFSGMSQAFIAAGGLVGPAVAAALFFAGSVNANTSRICMSIIGVFCVVAEFMYVRNSFGWLFVGCIAAISLWLAQQPQGWRAQVALVFVAVQLSLSVFSRSDYLFTAVANTQNGPMPSDVAQIANALFPPYWFWGLLCGLFSLGVLAVGLWIYMRKA